jgi:hypothetical protein
LITLAAYLAPDRLAPAVAGLSVSAVYARVPLPRTQTEIVRIDAFRVPEDVWAGMDQVAVRKDGEALDYRGLSAKLTGGGPRERRLRAVYDDGARVAEAEAEAYRRRCSCVYAVIVRAEPAALARVARRSEVRVVDAAPEVRRLDRAVFLPPLPEQTERAHPPADLAPTDGDPSTRTPESTPAWTDRAAPAGRRLSRSCPVSGSLGSRTWWGGGRPPRPETASAAGLASGIARLASGTGTGR